jgi:hypothetical protein
LYFTRPFQYASDLPDHYPDHTIADEGQGLKAGQKTALGDTSRHGDIFHIQKQCEPLGKTLICQLTVTNVDREQAILRRILHAQATIATLLFAQAMFAPT